MMKRVVLSVIILALMWSACSGGDGNETKTGDRHEQLTGTWVNDMMTVTFDWGNASYSGITLGEPFTRTLALVSEEGNVVKFTSDGNLIVCQIQDDGKILMRKDVEGAIPLIFDRE